MVGGCGDELDIFWWWWIKAFQHKLHLLTDCHETGNFGQRLPPASFTIHMSSKVQPFTISALKFKSFSISWCSKVQPHSALLNLQTHHQLSDFILTAPSHPLNLSHDYQYWFHHQTLSSLDSQYEREAKRLPISYSDSSRDIIRQQTQLWLKCQIVKMHFSGIT